MWCLSGKVVLLGKRLRVAVTSNDDKPILFKTLEEVQPYHWSKAYKVEELFD